MTRWTSAAGAEAAARYAEMLDFHPLPLAPQAAEAFGAEGPFAVLLRPDNHVACLSAALSTDDLSDYFDNFVGRRAG